VNALKKGFVFSAVNFTR